MENILITGCSGFIGSNFIHYYNNKYKDRTIIGLDKLTYAGNLNNIQDMFGNNSQLSIIDKKLLEKKYVNNIDNFIIDKDNMKFIKGDISDPIIIKSIFDKYNIDGVINFAAESHVDRSIVDPYIFLKTNVMGTNVLLDICRKKWKKEYKKLNYNNRYLQISTDEVYGSLGRNGYFTEQTSLNPHSPYSASKASADLIVTSYFDTYGLPINITRCSNNYGPYQFPEKLIPLIIMNALNNKIIPIYGDGKQIRDWIHVNDHCKAIDLVFEKAAFGEIYNIGGNNEQENIVLVKKIINILKEKTGLEHINEGLIDHVKDRLGHDRRYAIDASKIKNDLGWQPQTDFESGLSETIDWYIRNQKWLDDIKSGEYKNIKLHKV